MGVAIKSRKPRRNDRRMADAVSPAKFVKVWQNAASAYEVARKLGYITTATATARAGYYRGRGIPLKFMPVGSGIDVESLKALALKCGKKTMIPSATNYKKPARTLDQVCSQVMIYLGSNPDSTSTEICRACDFRPRWFKQVVVALGYRLRQKGRAQKAKFCLR